jgi:hypothetical protein
MDILNLPLADKKKTLTTIFETYSFQLNIGVSGNAANWRRKYAGVQEFLGKIFYLYS